MFLILASASSYWAGVCKLAAAYGKSLRWFTYLITPCLMPQIVVKIKKYWQKSGNAHRVHWTNSWKLYKCLLNRDVEATKDAWGYILWRAESTLIKRYIMISDFKSEARTDSKGRGDVSCFRCGEWLKLSHFVLSPLSSVISKLHYTWICCAHNFSCRLFSGLTHQQYWAWNACRNNARSGYHTSFDQEWYAVSDEVLGQYNIQKPWAGA